MPKRLPKPIHLPFAKVLASARRAFAKGLLQAQQPNPSHYCQYIDPQGCCCIIGAAMPKPFAQAIEAKGQESRDFSTFIGSLITKGLVTTDDREALVNLQHSHDRLCRPEPLAPLPERLARLREILSLPAPAPALTQES